MVTGSKLVFQGRADGEAYDALDGTPLWSQNLGSGISPPPITYTVEGKQSVSILVGWGGAPPAIAGTLAAQHGWPYRVHPHRLFTFSLDGKVAMPPSPPPSVPTPLEVADFQVDETLALEGRTLCSEVCAMCHGGGGKAPNLRASPISTERAAFAEVLQNGRQSLGMLRFREFGDREIDTLVHYIRRQARDSLKTASN